MGAARSLAGLFAVTGTAHLVAPRMFDRLIPAALGPPRPWVIGSGLAELACAAGLANPTTRRAASRASAVLLVAVFPGNVTMAVRSGGRPGWYRAVAWARLPVQVPLVLWALRAGRAGS